MFELTISVTRASMTHLTAGMLSYTNLESLRNSYETRILIDCARNLNFFLVIIIIIIYIFTDCTPYSKYIACYNMKSSYLERIESKARPGAWEVQKKLIYS